MTDPKFGPLGKDVLSRTYLRETEDGMRETWDDLVKRVVTGNFAFVDAPVIEEERGHLTARITDMRLLPAGRHLWATGIDTDSQFIDNCFMVDYYNHENLADHFCFTFMRLMEGGGVGTNYSDSFIYKLPILTYSPNLVLICDPCHKDWDREFKGEANAESLSYLCDTDYDKWYHNRNVIHVEDSREGWSKALEAVMNSFTEGNDVIINLTSVRPYGTRIRGFGGTASGPYFLALMLRNIHAILTECAKRTRKLSGLDCNRIDHEIAKTVVSGNVRRSARLGCKLWSDSDIREFISCKEGNTAIWTANLSVDLAKGGRSTFLQQLSDGRNPSQYQMLYDIADRAHANGEPGILNLDTAIRGRLDPDDFRFQELEPITSPNPCVTGDTLVLVYRGWITAKDAAKECREYGCINFWNGHEYSSVSNFRCTDRNAEVWQLTFSNGTVIQCTKYHEFVLLDDSRITAELLEKGQFIKTGNCRQQSPLPYYMKVTEEDNAYLESKVKLAGTHPVYCGTEPELGQLCFNGIVTGQCSEIVGSDLCCLGHVNMAAHDNLEDMLHSCRLMTRFLIRATFSRKPDPRLQVQVNRNRRIGVGVTGFHNWLVKQGIKYSECWKEKGVIRVLRLMYETIRDEARAYSYALRIPEPVKVTAIAPCGTISLLPGVAQGIHPVFALRFIRRTLYNMADENQVAIVERLRKEGAKIEDSVYTAGTVCASYLCEDTIVNDAAAPSVLEDAHDISVQDQLEVLAMFQEHFADNAVSFTANFDNTRVTADDLARLIVQFMPRVKGMTFMPFVHDRPQAPYTRLTKEEFDAMAGTMKASAEALEIECAGGACPVV